MKPRRQSHPIVLKRLNSRKEEKKLQEKPQSESYPPSRKSLPYPRFSPHIWFENTSPNPITRQMTLLWRKADVVRRYRRANYQLAKLISDLAPGSSSFPRSFFSKQITKNIFYSLSLGIDLLDPEEAFQLSRKFLIYPEDLKRYQKIDPKFEVSTSDLSLDKKVYTSSPTRYHRLNVYRSYQQGQFVFSEWKDRVYLSPEAYFRLRERYTGPVALFDHYLFVIGLRYSHLRGRRLYQRVPSQVVRNYQLTEAFASPLEAVSETYYSPFPDESVFSSQGNFFGANLPPGRYLLHPPSHGGIILRAVERAISHLETKEEYHFILVSKAYPGLEDSFGPYLSSEKNIDHLQGYDFSYDRWFSLEEFQIYYLTNGSPKIDLDQLGEDWKNSSP